MASNRVQFYLYAENATAGTFSCARRLRDPRTADPASAGELVINELMAYNEGLVLDEQGEADD